MLVYTVKLNNCDQQRDEKNEMERDKDRGAEMKCQNVFGWNGKGGERNIKAREEAGEGVAGKSDRERRVKTVEKKGEMREEMNQGLREEG